MYQSKSGVKIFSFYWWWWWEGGARGGSLDKIFFFPVWTCIKPNLVSKIFPFTSRVGVGGSLDKKKFFSSLKMYQAKSGVKIFSLYRWGGGVPLQKNFFFQSEHVSSQIWCQNCFPLPMRGGSLYKKFFFPVWTCIKPNLVSKNFPFTSGGGVPRQNFFLPVWTCIKPNLVSKIFPFTGGGGGGGPSTKNFFLPVWTCIKPNLLSKIFPFTETGYPPPPQVWIDTQSENITFRHASDAGGNYSKFPIRVVEMMMDTDKTVSAPLYFIMTGGNEGFV